MNTHYWKRTMLLYTVLFLDYLVFSETKVSYIDTPSFEFPRRLFCVVKTPSIGYGSVRLLKEAESTRLASNCIIKHFCYWA